MSDDLAAMDELLGIISSHLDAGNHGAPLMYPNALLPRLKRAFVNADAVQRLHDGLVELGQRHSLPGPVVLNVPGIPMPITINLAKPGN